jgi:hypothetical protein
MCHPLGAVAFGLCFCQLADYQAFMVMGIMIFASAALSVFFNIPGETTLFESCLGRDQTIRSEKVTEKKQIIECREEFYV